MFNTEDYWLIADAIFITLFVTSVAGLSVLYAIRRGLRRDQ
ncbi:hypothetical protein [Pluralibacter sp.]|jgi:hypothetical protein|nr:hypothetical protein [Pluralibacter sp.]